MKKEKLAQTILLSVWRAHLTFYAVAVAVALAVDVDVSSR